MTKENKVARKDKYCLTQDVYKYLADLSTPKDKDLCALDSYSKTLREGRMQITPEQGAFLKFITQSEKPKLALEIGTMLGYSTMCIAKGLSDGGKLITLDRSNNWIEKAKEFWADAGVLDKIEFKQNDALVSLEELIKEYPEGSFDFVFIDADKGNYLNYYEYSLKLLKKGGVVIIDNVLLWGLVIDPEETGEVFEKVRQFNDFLAKDSRVEISGVPLGDGFILARKL